MRILLIHPRIPQNAGAIARLAAATNTELVLARPLGFRIDQPAARRPGLDYWDAADVKIAPDWRTAIAESPAPLFALTRHATRSLYDAAIPAESTLIFGAETDGLPDELIAAIPAENRLRIPILNADVRSLNLANAVAIALYEALRQQGAR